MRSPAEIHTEADPPAPIPWRRVARLLKPLRRGVIAMLGLSVGGVLVGLVAPLAIGVLIDDLVSRGDNLEALLLAALIAFATLLEASAYIASDGLYARNASRLYRDVRLQMFAGAARRSQRREATAGLSSRFVSDAETLESITMLLLDTGSMVLIEFATAVVALAVLEAWAVVVIVPALAAIWALTRRTQEPIALAGQRRQEALEAMTSSINQELDGNMDWAGLRRFRAAVENLMATEIRYGWLRALNLQGSGGLAKLGPIAVVVVAASVGTKSPGTLISLYLLAQRAFWGFDGLVDLSLGMKSVRGGVARSFDLIDTPGVETAAERLLPV
jgi:ABC-type bacteriocin/lantibiotic exporter with double-glycine peptidase domain